MRIALLIFFFMYTSQNLWTQSKNSRYVEPFKSTDPNGRSLASGINKLTDLHLSTKKFIEKDLLLKLQDMLDDSYHESTINMIESRDYLRLSMDMMINQNPLYWQAMNASEIDANILMIARICWHVLDDEIEKADRLCRLASFVIDEDNKLSSIRQSLAARIANITTKRDRLLYQITLQRNKGNKFDAELALNALQRQFEDSPQLLFTAYQLKLTEYDIDQADEIMLNWSICTDTVLKTDRLFPINFPATTLDKLYEITIRSQINEKVKMEKLTSNELAQIAMDALEMEAADFAAHIFHYLQSIEKKKSQAKEYRHCLYYCFSKMGVIQIFSNKESYSAQNKFEKISAQIQQQRYAHPIFSGKTMAKKR